MLDLVNNLQVRQVGTSNRFQVSLKGPILRGRRRCSWSTPSVFKKKAKDESDFKNSDTSEYASGSLGKLKEELAVIDKNIFEMLSTSKTIGPGARVWPRNAT